MAVPFDAPDVGEYSCTRMKQGIAPAGPQEARRWPNFRKSGWSGT